MPLDTRERTLVELSVLATRSQYRERLTERIRSAQTEGIIRDEIYEAFLQLYLFAGFPAALESVRALSRAWPIERSASPEEIANGEVSKYPSFLAEGEALYKVIYGKNAPVVRKGLLDLSPELATWAVIEGYGKTLSRPNLDVKTRELCIVGILTHLGWDRQLYSHMLGAVNAGATRADVESACAIGTTGDGEDLLKVATLLSKLPA
jgi:4-carboxymuconolactone decarboxylase